jgi:hypothetical protein
VYSTRPKELSLKPMACVVVNFSDFGLLRKGAYANRVISKHTRSKPTRKPHGQQHAILSIEHEPYNKHPSEITPSIDIPYDRT